MHYILCTINLTFYLKLEILTNLATETNISIILREFQTYVTSSDQEFAAATIQAIGRCASNIVEVTDTCLNGLVSLLANRNGKQPLKWSLSELKTLLHFFASVFETTCRKVIASKCCPNLIFINAFLLNYNPECLYIVLLPSQSQL